MMKTKAHRIATILGFVTFAACGESATETALDHLTPQETAELAALGGDGSTDVAVELGATASDVAETFGLARFDEGRSLNVEADVRFAAARAALSVGDRRRALDEAREARRLIARAVLATGGGEAVVLMIERLEDLTLTPDEDNDVFEDPAALRTGMETIAAEARDLFARGDSVGAAERAVLGEQIALWHRHRHILTDRARLAVSLAATSVALAERLVNASDTPVPVRPVVTTNVQQHQNRWLAHAKRMLARAERSLAAGHYARAVHYAEHAHWLALKAVVLPGGVTEEELRAMLRLAHHLYEEAKIAIGDDPTRLELWLFERAGKFVARGERMLAAGYKRGVALVWSGAVISRWLMD
jgi:HEPN domain-containing protein